MFDTRRFLFFYFLIHIPVVLCGKEKRGKMYSTPEWKNSIVRVRTVSFQTYLDRTFSDPFGARITKVS